MSYSLDDNVSDLPHVGPVYQKRLKALGINTVGDLLFHTPKRYDDYKLIKNIKDLKPEDKVTVQGKVEFFRNQYTKGNKKIQIMSLNNNTGKITAVWFNQPFLIKSIKKDSEVSLSGKVEWFGKTLALVAPDWEILYPGRELIHTARVVPNYSTTSGISSKWLRRQINNALKNTEIIDKLPEKIKGEYGLIDLKEALVSIHFPNITKDIVNGRERLAFDELLLLQLSHMQRKKLWSEKNATFNVKADQNKLKKFIDKLPFKLTSSQIKAYKEILNEINSDIPMNKLLQGDVGSGKTVVAVIASYVVTENGAKTVIMAPTQILAQQHYQTFKKLLTGTKMKIALITANEKAGNLNKSDIVIGTHALLYKSVDLNDVALVIIDEQHRFGVKERAKLTKYKNKTPHVLTMSATPIPRTVALTFYGDLSVTTLTDMPKGRIRVTTWIVPESKREGAYGWISEQIKNTGVQAFVVCPLIEESGSELLSEVKSAKAEFEKLTKALPDLKIGLLHGKLKGEEKNAVVADFKNKKYDILVTTSVVEVGIDVPNATIIIVEGAERFGLAQLHQIRGRVGRGGKKSYCLLFSNSDKQKSKTRLEILKSTHSGFELAELDLKLRGPGEIFGTKQHGLPELKYASWQDYDLIKKTRKCAAAILDNPKEYKLFHNYLGKKIISQN